MESEYEMGGVMVQVANNELDCELGGEVQEVNTSGKPVDTVVCGSLQPSAGHSRLRKPAVS